MLCHLDKLCIINSKEREVEVEEEIYINIFNSGYSCSVDRLYYDPESAKIIYDKTL